eukprot:jgi/Bigna1/143639/aug1.80_g18347
MILSSNDDEKKEIENKKIGRKQSRERRKRNTTSRFIPGANCVPGAHHTNDAVGHLCSSMPHQPKGGEEGTSNETPMDKHTRKLVEECNARVKDSSEIHRHSKNVNTKK